MPTAVMPTWTVEITETGSSMSRSAAAARRLPASARGWSAARRAVTTEYSPMTKNALRATSPSTARTRRTSLTGANGRRSVDHRCSGYDPTMSKKILALVSEPVSADALRSAVGDEDANDAEVLVVAPALNTRTRFLLADPDGAIERADAVQEETVERLNEEGVDAAGDTGEENPLLALQDALVTFEADEIVVFTHPEGDANWKEEGLVEDARQRFAPKPVRHIVVE